MHSRHILMLCLALWLGLTFPLCTLADDSPTWDANSEGQFILSLTRDLHGNLWVGTEGEGVWRFAPKAATGKQWTQFTQKDGLGDDNAYALACDKAGRIWAGTLNHGVSVFNGKAWKTYGQIDGPLGCRVFALAVSPMDGSVWGATEAGLFRYKNSSWTYFTRAEGLPSDQANALAFGSDGTLYVGTQCDGIAIASSTNNYHSWRVVTGPRQIPCAATGYGLPSALINCLFVASNGTVYAGTTCGLAASRDKGWTWHFRRGLDWKAKLAGLYHPIAPDTIATQGDLLQEDYVTCLGENRSGHLFVGHRQGGLESFDMKTGKRIQSGEDGVRADDYVSALRVEGKAVCVGLYGDGLLIPNSSAKLTAAVSLPATSIPPLPEPAKPPTMAELTAMLARVKSMTEKMPVGSAAYLGEDWQTQGDWVGRYGRKLSILCAARAPLNHDIQRELPYSAQEEMGPHHDLDDSIRYHCTWIKTENPKSLYDPIPGYRCQAEWGDHGEAYPRAFEGPDIWISINVPEGIQRISLYFMNKDGHSGENRCRDYTVEIQNYQQSLEIANTSPFLAQARVNALWGGVYKSFVVRGPSKYLIKIGKNNSLNTLVSAVFIDKLRGPATMQEGWPLAWMGAVHYDPPDPNTLVMPDPHLLDKLLAEKESGIGLSVKTTSPIYLESQGVSTERYSNLWSSLDEAYDDQDSIVLQKTDRLLAYRALLAAHGSDLLQTNWRWFLQLWLPVDRDQFKSVMTHAHDELLRRNPQMQGLEY